MTYTALIEKGVNGYYVSQCAELPAAISQGKTIAEARDNLIDAIELLLLDMKEDRLKAMQGRKFIRRKIAV
ncbi:MAG: type II toxin-antitoxin system HicB family antitoxin [Dysgonamonadaceae bacterium]|jgi:predicted RNase H-like HicB family nuclease|nr:type II toxin-antitoxin system HicB family antitoxin [Dysgonamonadaceae bacterium]